MPWQQFRNPLQEALFAGKVIKRKQSPQGRRVYLAGNGRIGDDRLDFRGEVEGLGRLTIVERLDADAITSRKQSAAVRVPDCECKHSLKSLKASRSEFFVRVNDDFGI